MTGTVEDGIETALNAGLIETGSERLVDPKGFPIQRRHSCRCQRGSLDGGQNGLLLAAHKVGNGNSDGEGDFGCPPGSDDSDDTEMEAILQEFIKTLIGLLEPRYGEVVWRTEILNHPSIRIATELGLSEQAVAKRLQLGRRTLLHLVVLTLKSPLAD